MDSISASLGDRVVDGFESASIPIVVSVCIPTYQRPEYLRRAVASVLVQTRKADEILIVSRDDDASTQAAVRQLIEENTRANIRSATVDQPGFLPPVRKAVAEASGNVIVLLDDDAEAHPTWLGRMCAHYADPTVGGVGGRCINYFAGVLQSYPPARMVGSLSWYGRSTGNMYRDCVFTDAVEVVHLMGGNMSYRAELFADSLPDERIGSNVAFHWELDVGLQVKRKGYRILFDPGIVVDHHSAPRATTGMRAINYEAMYWANYNYALLMRKHLKAANLAAYLAYSALVGWNGSPGLAHAIYSGIKGKPPAWRDEILASVRGRIAGLRA